MQRELFAAPAGSCGRTCPEPSRAAAVETLESWLGRWLGANLAFRVEGGERAELLSAKTGWSNGGCWTRNMSEWNLTLAPSLNDAGVCSLSSILETGSIDRRYFLSQRACAGILRRAEKRGKELPETLRAALIAVASTAREATGTLSLTEAEAKNLWERMLGIRESPA